MSQLRLHGIRRQSTATVVEPLQNEEDDEVKEMVSNVVQGRKTEEMRKTLQRSSSSPIGSTHQGSRPPSAGNSVWKRRHSLSVAQKNNEWAQLYLSTAATHNSMAGFLSVKGNRNLDAEYFYNFIPKAVIEQDMLYKELLAVFNALHFWSPGLMKEKKILLAIGDLEAAHLIKSANVMGTIGPKKILLLQEINELSKKYTIELRIAELEGAATDMIAYSLARSDEAKHKLKFQMQMAEQSKLKGERFLAKDRVFPPSYV